MDLANKEISGITRKKSEAGLASKVTVPFFTEEPTILIVPKEVFLANVLKAAGPEKT